MQKLIMMKILILYKPLFITQDISLTIYGSTTSLNTSHVIKMCVIRSSKYTNFIAVGVFKFNFVCIKL